MDAHPLVYHRRGKAFEPLRGGLTGAFVELRQRRVAVAACLVQSDTRDVDRDGNVGDAALAYRERRLEQLAGADEVVALVANRAEESRGHARRVPVTADVAHRDVERALERL